MHEPVLMQVDQALQVLQVPQEECLRVTFLTLVHLEIRDILDLMAHKV